MKKITYKIISGTILFGCTIFGLTALNHINNDSDSIPASITAYDETPIIVLDAGHGECS